MLEQIYGTIGAKLGRWNVDPMNVRYDDFRYVVKESAKQGTISA
jgi:hypothetical protein